MTSSSAASSPHLHITITNPTLAIPTATNNTKSQQHHHHHSGAPSQSISVSPRSGGSGGSGTTNQACAACKYQRRKCNPDCPLAPYFPADQQLRFLHAHRLFGVSNILKTLKRLNPEARGVAMQTLIYQAEMRATDPAGGCCRLIAELEHTVNLELAELAALQHHLDLCRQAAPCVGALPPGGPCADLEVSSSSQQPPPLLLGADQDQVDVDALYVGQEAGPVVGADHDDLNDDSPQPQEHHGGQQQQQPQQLYDYFYYETTSGAAGEDAGRKPGGGVDINVDVMEHFDYDSDNDVDHVPHKVTPMISSGLGQQHYQINGHKEYQMKVAALVDVFDIRQELQAVDVNAADIGVKEELDQEDDAKNNIALGAEAAAHMADSSHCRLGLGF